MWGLFRASTSIEAYLPVSPVSAMFFGMFPIDVSPIIGEFGSSEENIVPIDEISKTETKTRAFILIPTNWGEYLH